MADSNPRIPSSEDIRRLFEQLPDDTRRDGNTNAPPPPPAGGPEETSAATGNADATHAPRALDA